MNENFTSNKPYLFRAILDWLLDNNATPYILVDTSYDYVEVPSEHVKDGQIVLNINPSAVQNWHVDDQGISFSARFSGSARQIYVPMNSLLAIYSQENGQGMAFPSQEVDSAASSQEESIDENFVDETESDKNEENTIALKSKPLSAVKESKKASKKIDPKNKKVSHLKVVK